MENLRLDRRDVVKKLLHGRNELLVVSGLGAATWDLAAVRDCPFDFPLWGAMGGSTMVGLGLAIAQPSKKVLVITGDGEMLMGMSGLATIAVQHPRNLRIVVLDNERYGETGKQQTHTAMGADLAAIAAGCGFLHTRMVRRHEDVECLRQDIYNLDDLFLAVIKISDTNDPMILPPRDGVYLKNRMRMALLGTQELFK